jgi:glycosyltransferase involved in cell wall biosynthesis
MTLSIVSPIYKAENFIIPLVNRLSNCLNELNIDYEIILVDDLSPDNSWEIIENITHNNKQVKGIQLSRNFGQHYAITAGLEQAKGEWIVVMDCDLQDIPEEIKKLYNKAVNENFDIVLARREQRKDTFIKRFLSLVFYRFLNYCSGLNHDEKIANFGIYNKKVVDAILSMPETIKYLPLMVNWVGFRKSTMNVLHDERDGQSSYGFRKRVQLALDVFLSYSDKPLKIFVKLGALISISSFIFSIIYMILWLNDKIVVHGFTTIIISVWFLSGIIISILGVIGLYIGKTFQDVKKRPVYIINKTTFSNN